MKTLVTNELAVASQQYTVSHFFSIREFQIKNNMAVVHHPPYGSLFPRLKLKGNHFDTTEVIEVKSQNSTSRMNFKNSRSTGNGAYAKRGTTSRVIVASKFKVSF
jgi:hypothetical protein